VLNILSFQASVRDKISHDQTISAFFEGSYGGAGYTCGITPHSKRSTERGGNKRKRNEKEENSEEEEGEERRGEERKKKKPEAFADAAKTQ